MKESTGSPASSNAAATRRTRVPEDRRKAFVKMNSIIQECIQKKLPAYYFLTAFSLVMSRLSHPLGECFALLQEIVVQCILHFPNQTLWQFMSLYRPRPTEAGSKLLSERVNRVLNDAHLKVIQPKVTKYKLIFEELSRLCKAPKSNQIAPGKKPITAAVKAGSTLLKSGYFGEILIPAQKFLTIMLPRAASRNYNPFPEREVFVAGIGQEATVYSSMQRPIRVDLIGTDGNVYPMIFKAMDDLRIDSRAMEFNAVVNMYLKRDVDGRDRGLRIRTYTVLPLIEKCGVIEFVPNLNTMRLITMEMRRSLGIEDVPARKHKMNETDDIEKKRERFLELRQLYKPVLHEWYKMEFPNPSSWYIARSAYVRTLATMSIVGYFLGLGDRHNDNILLDLTNGDVVHVDFNALFNKGETLPVPERVPFRLTHSMVKAMGPLGSEGAFLYTCEIVSRVLRSRKDQLVSVLNTFLYDPSDFFTDGVRNRAHVVELVATNLQNVELRLSGSVRSNKRESSLLSVEGQTKRLIEEATNIDNLCQMFHGWGAYM